MKITEQVPIREVNREKYWAEHGRALPIEALVEGGDYHARIVYGHDDADRYAADYWVVVNRVKIPMWNRYLPSFVTKYARITMLAIDSDTNSVTEEADRRKVLYDGTLVAPMWSDWPIPRHEDGYFVSAVDERDFALSSLLKLSPEQPLVPVGT